MITYRSITKACKGKTYDMVLRGLDRKYVTAAVNQGIDSHLEACDVQGRDLYELKNNGLSGTELHCKVSPKSLPVLLRRLASICDDAHLLASDILYTLGIKDADPFDIVSPVDEKSHAKR